MSHNEYVQYNWAMSVFYFAGFFAFKTFIPKRKKPLGSINWIRDEFHVHWIGCNNLILYSDQNFKLMAKESGMKELEGKSLTLESGKSFYVGVFGKTT